MINIKGVSKSFDENKALDNVCMNIKKGSIYGLVGANGAGKTTLIKTLTGVYKQDKGSVRIAGEEVYENTRIKDRLIYIPDMLYYPTMYTVKDMARFYKGVYSTWSQERFERLGEVFKLSMNKRINSMSKGMQRQVAFWLGLSAMPDYLILDEPMDGLDPIIRQKIKSIIVQDVAERQMTVIISSHNLRELEDICDHVGILHAGELMTEKDLDDLKSDIHKLQIAFKEGVPDKLIEELDIVYSEKRGSLGLYIIRGEREKIEKSIKKHNPAVFDMLPLTLEEIFIYEMGDLGYDIKNIIL